MPHAGLLIPNREIMTNQGSDTTHVQLGEPMSFIGVAYRNTGEASLIGGETIQRQLCHRSPPQDGWQPKSGNP